MVDRPIPFSAPMVRALIEDLSVPEGVQLKPIPGISEKYKAGSDGHVYCYSACWSSSALRAIRLSDGGEIGEGKAPEAAIQDFALGAWSMGPDHS